MKKAGKRFVVAVVLLIVLGVYYYVTIPAINIHSAGFWQCLLWEATTSSGGEFLRLEMTARRIRTKNKGGIIPDCTSSFHQWTDHGNTN